MRQTRIEDRRRDPRSRLRPIAWACGTLLAASLLAGCYASSTPENAQAPGGPESYMAELRPMPSEPDPDGPSAADLNTQRCRADETLAGLPGAERALPLAVDPPVSPGDLLHLELAGAEAPSGNYKVNSNGDLSLGMIGDVPVAGLSVTAAQAAVAARLVGSGYFRPGFAHVTLEMLDPAPARVLVSGAVFQPGQVTIDETPAIEKDRERTIAAGDFPPGRSVSFALAHAAGVRPDADIRHIVVERGARYEVLDLGGLLDGMPVEDALLVDGDRVFVPTRHCFQSALGRPSPITPPGVRVFLSNLIVPAESNSGASVNRDAASLPYGTRLLQALVSANCVGGTPATNADRRAVLITANPMTGSSMVIERRIEALVRRPDRDSYNPVLLPNDAIACYDSVWSNVKDVISSLSTAVDAAVIVKALSSN